MTKEELYGLLLLKIERSRIKGHEEAEEQGGSPEYNCSGWNGPCGGCTKCFHMMVSYYSDKERERAEQAWQLGLIYLPQTIGWLDVHKDYSVGVQACATWQKLLHKGESND